MIRNLFALVGLAVILAGATSYFAYGTLEPCKMYAKEWTYRNVGNDGGALEGMAESMALAGASQMTTGECLEKLGQSWMDRLGFSEE